MEGRNPSRHQFLDSPKPHSNRRKVSGNATKTDANDHGNQRGGTSAKMEANDHGNQNQRVAVSTKMDANDHGSHRDVMATKRDANIVENRQDPIGTTERLIHLLNLPANKFCADCGAPDPKWVVVSVKLDEWTDEQVDVLTDSGGNAAVNTVFEAFLPESYTKPRQDCSSEERSDFIRRKYELQQFLSNPQLSCRPRNNEKQHRNHSASRHGLGHSFRNSWRRKEHEQKAVKQKVEMGMVEFVGLIKVNVIRGTNLAIRDMMTSDPYVIINLGHQSMKTKVVRSSLNPVWNERLMLSIPDPVPLLKLQVYDKDTFTTDDRMGEAEINIQPLVAAAKAYETATIADTAQLNRWMAKDGVWVPRDSVISVVDGKVKQVVTVRLQNVERGHLEMELECVPLTQ
ncbi:hypothetical protein ACP4OV_019463 [Aristida adscensionis]